MDPGPPLDCDTPRVRAWTVTLWLLTLVWLIPLAAPILATAIQHADDRVHAWTIAAGQDWLVALARLFDVVGGTAWSAVVIVIVAGVLAWQRRWPGLAVWLLVSALSETLNAAIKNVYERARPPAGLVEEHTYSFVSGHSMSAAAMGIALVLVFVPAGHHRRLWLAVAVAYALLMAGSRVYLRAHWLTDTLAGATVGATCALSVALVASWWHARAERPPLSDG